MASNFGLFRARTLRSRSTVGMSNLTLFAFTIESNCFIYAGCVTGLTKNALSHDCIAGVRRVVSVPKNEAFIFNCFAAFLKLLSRERRLPMQANKTAKFFFADFDLGIIGS